MPTSLSPELQNRLLWTAVALFLPWLIRSVVMRTVNRRTSDPRLRYQWRKTSQYVGVIATLIAVGRVWLEGLETITTVLGLVGAGLAVALNQPITNVAGWLLIVARRPFEVGDRIQIGETRGDVIDLGVFQFTLMEVGNWVDAEQSTGRVMHVPNAKVFSHELANYHRGFDFIWIELPVLVTFESDWREAKRILIEIAKELSGDIPTRAAKQMTEASSRYMVKQGKLTPIVYTSVRDSGVLLTVRMLAAPAQRRNMEQDVWERILLSFAERRDIDFAYPTQRFYDNRGEGKEGKAAKAAKGQPASVYDEHAQPATNEREPLQNLESDDARSR